MNHLGTVTLETERLILRPFRMSDAEAMYNNWANSDHVTKFLTWPTHTSVEVTKEIIASWVKENGNPKNYQWCMEYKENHQPIGSFGVVKMEEEIDSIEIGYCIGEAYWFHGLTAEAFSKIIEFMFEEVGCNRIWSCHDVHNPNSGKVMKKVGMQKEGTLRQAARDNQGICDIDVYGILRSEYEAKTTK